MSPVPPPRRREVLSLFAARSAAAESTPDPESAGELSAFEGLPLDGLLMAERDGQPVGAALFVVQPGGVAFVWPPVVGEERAAHALVEELCRRIDAAGCRLGQCLLEDGARDAPLMERHGFVRLTGLLYMERRLDPPLPTLRDAAALGAIEFDPPHNQARFAALLDATYAGTLDCPELNGCRSADEALEGHRATGRFDPRLWRLYEHGGSDAGLILLADHPGHCREVVYMGVAPAFRGRGVGRAMATHALREAQAAGREAVLLGVDVRNTPARRLYEQLGFRALCRREIHLRRLP